MSKYQTPYRYDFVGSFLRPQEVKQAKADYSEGKITKEECDIACEIGATMMAHKFCSAQAKTSWYDPILYLLFCNGWVSAFLWFMIIYAVFSTICASIY